MVTLNSTASRNYYLSQVRPERQVYDKHVGDVKKLNYKHLRKPGMIWQRKEAGSHVIFLVSYELADEVLEVL